MRLDFHAGLIRLHLLHHADKEGPIFGLGMIEELGRHGYRLSPGTLYPLLHRLEEAGYLKSRRTVVGGKVRRGYAITAAGRKQLRVGRQRVRELFGELFEEDSGRKKRRMPGSVPRMPPR
jgi:DNA-binding PadR family transcriptional regulator